MPHMPAPCILCEKLYPPLSPDDHNYIGHEPSGQYDAADSQPLL